MRNKLIRGLTTLIIGTAGLVGNSQAGYSGLTYFGDSLSDTGNVLSLTTLLGTPFPAFPGAEGRFSNGPVWTEALASGLGFAGASNPANLLFTAGSSPFPPSPVVLPIGPQGGQNFAYGGARTGLGGAAGATTGLLGQLIAWNGSPFSSTLTRVADPDALYVMMIGANDLRDARNANSGLTAGDVAVRAAAAGEVAGNIINAVKVLALAGAQHFMLSSLPDLGKTPEAVGMGAVAASTDITLAFNAALLAATDALDTDFLVATGVDLDLRMLNFFGLSEAIQSDAANNGGASYGITNVSTPCINVGAFSGAYFAPDATSTDCDVSAFSDFVHPSAKVGEWLAELALATAVPEPDSLALVIGALLLLAAARRRAA